MDSIAKNVWTKPRERLIPALWPMIAYWSWNIDDYLDTDTGSIFSIWDHGTYIAVWDQEAHQRTEQAVYDKFLSEKINLDKLRQRGIAAGEAVVSHVQDFELAGNSASLEEYISFFESLEKKLNTLSRHSIIYWFLASGYIERLIDKRLKSYAPDAQTEIISTLSQPLSATYSEKQEQAFLALKRLHSPKAEPRILEREVSKFVKQYFWFPYEFVGPDVWTTESVKERLIQDFNLELTNLEDRKSEQTKCIKKYSLDEDLVELFEALQTFSLMQDDRKMHNAQYCYYLNGVIAERLANKLAVPLDQSRYTDSKVLRLFLDDDSEARNLLQRRVDFLVVEQNNGNTVYKTDKDAKKHLNLRKINLTDEKEDIDSVQGQAAYTGMVSGKVRICLSSQGCSDFEEGNILVTNMTTPDFIYLMKKASAIVTDEGGLTCHAAIVSRELKKPCIIGTKIATKVLKDGDEVEVDAERGIVTILKKV